MHTVEWYYVSFLTRYFDFLVHIHCLNVFIGLVSPEPLLSLPISLNSYVVCLLVQFLTQSILSGKLPFRVPPADVLWRSSGRQHSPQPGNPFGTFLHWVPCFAFSVFFSWFIPSFFSKLIFIPSFWWNTYQQLPEKGHFRVKSFETFYVWKYLYYVLILDFPGHDILSEN